jgi:hypothetical protein
VRAPYDSDRRAEGSGGDRRGGGKGARGSATARAAWKWVAGSSCDEKGAMWELLWRPRC